MKRRVFLKAVVTTAAVSAVGVGTVLTKSKVSPEAFLAALRAKVLKAFETSDYQTAVSASNHPSFLMSANEDKLAELLERITIRDRENEIKAMAKFSKLLERGLS